MPLLSMLVAGGPRVKQGSASTRVAVMRIGEANSDVAVLMPIVFIYSRERLALAMRSEGHTHRDAAGTA